jgi:hypothetical protein
MCVTKKTPWKNGEKIGNLKPLIRRIKNKTGFLTQSKLSVTKRILIGNTGITEME